MLTLGRFKEKVDFSNEELCFCYSDIWEDNFLITKAGQIYVIDFQDAAFLPMSFMSFVLHKPTKPLIPKIPAKFSLNAMKRVSYILKKRPRIIGLVSDLIEKDLYCDILSMRMMAIFIVEVLVELQ